jgi:glucose-6-phosphate isomerase
MSNLLPAVRKGNAAMTSIAQSQPWKALEEHYREMSSLHMRELFAKDPQRFARFSLRLGPLLFDYSKNRITERTMALLMDLARHARVPDDARPCSPRAHQRHRGPRRAHTLRNRSGPARARGRAGRDCRGARRAGAHGRLRQGVRGGSLAGPTTGGASPTGSTSHRGRTWGELVCRAWPTMRRPPAPHSSQRGRHAYPRTLRRKNPETTQFIVASKTFTTRRR